MARIPIYERQRTIPAGATGPTASGASPIGEAMGKLGTAIQAYTQDRKRLEDFEDERRFEALKESESKRFLEAQTGAQPGAKDFTRGHMTAFEEAATRYIAETPERGRQQAEYRVAQLRRGIAVEATRWELGERDRYIKSETGAMLEKQLPGVMPDTLDSSYARADEIIAKAGLPPIDADGARKAFRSAAQRAAILKLSPAERIRALGVPAATAVTAPAGASGLSPASRDAVIRTVIAEAGGEAREGMAAVAHVIRNRASAGRYGGRDPRAVVTAAGQFEPWMTVEGRLQMKGIAADSAAYQNAAAIVDEVFGGNASDPTGGATHFYAPGPQAQLGRQPPKWASDQPLASIGGHRFYAPEGKVVASSEISPADRNAAAAGRDAPAPSEVDPRFADLTFDERLRLSGQAERDQAEEERAARLRTEAEYDARVGVLGVAVERNQIGVRELDVAYEDGKGWLRAREYITLRNSIDQASREQRDLAAGLARIEAGERFNPFDSDDRRQADAVYRASGGAAGLLNPEPVSPAGRAAAQAGRDPQQENTPRNRLRAWVAKAGTVPEDALVAIRSAIASDDPAIATRGLQLAAEAIRVDVKAFDGRDGAQKLKDDTAVFSRLVEVVGLAPEEAARRMIVRRDPANTAAFAAGKGGKEGADKFARSLTEDDVLGAFPNPQGRYLMPLGIPVNPLGWFDDSAEFATEGVRNAMVADFREIAYEAFLSERGDVDAAKAIALSRVRDLYGVSWLTGSPILMRLPPDGPRGYPPVNGSHDYIVEQARSAIREATQKDVPAADIRLLPNVDTIGDIQAGRAPAYDLWYYSKDPVTGVKRLETLIGSAFVADPKAAQDSVTEQRRKEFEAERKRQGGAVDEDDPPGFEFLRNRAEEARRHRQRTFDQLGGIVGAPVSSAEAGEMEKP